MLGQDDEMPVDMHMGDVREVTPPSRCLSPQRWPFVLLPPLDQKLFLPFVQLTLPSLGPQDNLTFSGEPFLDPDWPVGLIFISL